MRFHTVGLSLVLFLSYSATVLADEEMLPEDYTKATESKEYIFVMLPTKKGWFDFVEKNKAIRDKYPQSGLYRNDESRTPLWTVDWYSHKHEVYLSTDGRYVVRMGPWPRLWADKDLENGGPALKQPAVAFYKEGKLLKGYTIGQLVKDAKKLSRSVSHFRWEDKVAFDDATGRFTVSTLEGNKYVFDIHSGKIVST